MNKHHGSTLDDLLDETGERDEVEALAAKRILAIRAERRMTELGMSTSGLAAKMHTSRSQLLRVLDKDDAGITLKMLFRLSQALDLQRRLSFARPGEKAQATRRRLSAAKPKRARPKTRRAARRPTEA